MKRTTFSCLLAAGVFLLFSIVSARGCVCDTPQPVDAALKDASAVFAGRFVRSEYRKGIKNENYELHADFFGKKGEEYEVLVYVFEVKTWWKGDVTREAVLISDHVRAKDGTETISDCDLGFESGHEYLVYAYGNGDGFGTNACSRTAGMKRGAKDIARLNKITHPRRP